MRVTLLIVLAALLTCRGGFAHEYQVAAGCMFLNEEDVLEEWLEYHLMLGVEHFWLYDDGSTDRSVEVLQPYIDSGVVEMVEGAKGGHYIPRQRAVHRELLNRAKGVTKWLALIDVDEFILPKKVDSIPEFLSEYEDQGMGVIIFWRIFGTGGIKSRENWNLLTESFTWCAEENHPRHLKSPKAIVQVDKLHPTYFHALPKEDAFIHDNVHWKWKETGGETPFGGTYKLIPVDSEDGQLNHYWCRSEQYFIDTKIPRKTEVWTCLQQKESRREKKIQSLRDDYNRVQDFQIQRFVPELKRRLGRD